MKLFHKVLKIFLATKVLIYIIVINYVVFVIGRRSEYGRKIKGIAAYTFDIVKF